MYFVLKKNGHWQKLPAQNQVKIERKKDMNSKDNLCALGEKIK